MTGTVKLEEFTREGWDAAGLHHHHLPALDAANIVEYDTKANEVQHGPHFEEAVTMVETAEKVF